MASIGRDGTIIVTGVTTGLAVTLPLPARNRRNANDQIN